MALVADHFAANNPFHHLHNFHDNETIIIIIIIINKVTDMIIIMTIDNDHFAAKASHNPHYFHDNENYRSHDHDQSH